MFEEKPTNLNNQNANTTHGGRNLTIQAIAYYINKTLITLDSQSYGRGSGGPACLLYVGDFFIKL